MALQIELRNGTAAQWTSTNPVLAQGEIGAENDTGKFKIGDGITVWNSISYAGSTGATQTTPYKSFGDGSDGNVTISTGVTTLSRDMYYNNLTINGTGIITTNNYKIFIKGILDLTSAPRAAINNNGNSGGNGSGSSGGSVGATQPSGSLAAISLGTIGKSGSINAGGTPTAPTAYRGNGGFSGNILAAGNGGTGGGGPGILSTNVSAATLVKRYETSLLWGATLIGGGIGGAGGPGGGGDGTFSGGGGGAGGNGGGVIAIYASIILKSFNTAAGVIQANGGSGGIGADGSSSGDTGGGGGGAGGGGGWVYICYNILAGPEVPGGIYAGGGNGGPGGRGFGAGNGAGGAGGGGGGRVTLINVQTSSGLDIIAMDNPTLSVSINPNPAMGLLGGNGGFGGLTQVTF